MYLNERIMIIKDIGIRWCSYKANFYGRETSTYLCVNVVYLCDLYYELLIRFM